MRRPPKPKIAGSNPAMPAKRIDSPKMQQKTCGLFVQRTESDGARGRIHRCTYPANHQVLARSLRPWLCSKRRSSRAYTRSLVKSERFRMKSGQIANNSFFLAFRNVVGFGIAITAVLLVIDPSILPYTSPLFILAIWLIPALAAFVPPIAGSEATWSAVEAKISLREQGGFGDGKRHTLRAQPGMDRVLEGLRDGRRQNNISAFLATTSLTLLCLSMLITPRSVAWNLLLLASMTAGIGLSIHSILTTYYIRLQADSMPLLIHYAPTHHPTQLGSPLGQLLQSHLDPDSQIEWAEWEARFHDAILPVHEEIFSLLLLTMSLRFLQ